jgi:hypothetical protein
MGFCTGILKEMSKACFRLLWSVAFGNSCRALDGYLVTQKRFKSDTCHKKVWSVTDNQPVLFSCFLQI